jgi:hypothetical protein
VIDVITQGFKDVQEGRLPEFPTSEFLAGGGGLGGAARSDSGQTIGGT